MSLAPPARTAPTTTARTRALLGLTAPLVAFLGCCLALTCLANQRAVALNLVDLSGRNPRFAGWLVFGALVGAVAAAGCLLVATRVGPGPGLALATVAGVASLTIGSQPLDGQGLAFGLFLLEASAGGLLGASLSTTLDLPRRGALASLTGWTLPLVAGWPVLAWLQARRIVDLVATSDTGQPSRIAVTPHPAGWLLAAVALALMAWAVLVMLVEPPVRVHQALAEQVGGLALAGVVAAGLLVLTLIGLSPSISLGWLRPSVTVVALLIVVGWALAVVTVSSAGLALSLTAVSVGGWTLPSLASFLLAVIAAGPHGLPWWVAVVVAAGGAAGLAVGFWRPAVSIPVGLCVLVAAVAGAWMMSGRLWLLVPAVVLLVAADAAVLAAGLRLAFTTPARLATVGAAGVAAVLCGLVVAVPLSWALVGDVPAALEPLRAGTRVLIGLCAAIAMLAAAYTANLAARLRSASTEDRAPVDLQDLTSREA